MHANPTEKRVKHITDEKLRQSDLEIVRQGDRERESKERERDRQANSNRDIDLQNCCSKIHQD